MASSNLFKPFIDLLPAQLRNKYFLILAVFFGILVFVDKHDLITQFRLQRTVNKLEQDKRFYKEKIEEAEANRAAFDENKERYAREHYNMKRSDEDVFIIVEEE